MVDRPGTSTNKTTISDTQSLNKQTILQQLTAISERQNGSKTIKKTSGPHKSKSRSAVTRDTKVMRQSDSTHPSNHSARRHSNTTDPHTGPSTVSLPTLDHLRTNDNIQKVVADRLLELQHLNSTGISQKNQINVVVLKSLCKT